MKNQDELIKDIVEILTDNSSESMACNFLVDEPDVEKLLQPAYLAIQQVEGASLYLLQNSFFPIGKKMEPLQEKIFPDLFTDYSNFFDKNKCNSFKYGIKQLINYTSGVTTVERRVELPDGQKNVIVVENFNLYDFNSQHTLMNHMKLPNFLVIGQVRHDLKFAEKHFNPDLFSYLFMPDKYFKINEM